jgi:hypothetical protein
MRQYVNLLGPQFRKQRQWLTLERTVAAAVLTGVVMAGVQFHSRQQVAGLQEELASAQALLKAQTAYTARLKGEGAAQSANAGLDAEIQRLEIDLKSARESMAVLEGGGLGNRSGFAGYLQAFSRQSLDGLWLTGFSVGGGGEVVIRGRVLSPELLPVYIQRLNREPVLQGREFAALEMRRPSPVPAKDAALAAAAKSDAPRYLEFALTTAGPADTAETAGAKK